MGFIEAFFKKNAKAVTKQDVEVFISRKIEENLNLDYKDIRAYHDFDELSKDVSAFANSEGGLILLGISQERVTEKRKIIKIFPKEITWGNGSLSKEKLEDNLISKIRPRVDFRIFPIREGNGTTKVIFLIDIPQSATPPHMASDNRYYKRLNFRRVPMEHYEVNNFFGRRRKPLLSLLMRIMNVVIENSEYQFTLRFFLQNKGKAVAKHSRVTASFVNLDIIKLKGNFQRLDYLRGLPSIQFDEHTSVFYPMRKFASIGDIELKVKNKNDRITITYDLIAEDMELFENKYSFDVNLLQKAKEQIKKGLLANLVHKKIE